MAPILLCQFLGHPVQCRLRRLQVRGKGHGKRLLALGTKAGVAAALTCQFARREKSAPITCVVHILRPTEICCLRRRNLQSSKYGVIRFSTAAAGKRQFIHCHVT